MTIYEGIKNDIDILNSINVPIGFMHQIGGPIAKVVNDLTEMKTAIDRMTKEQEKAKEEPPKEPEERPAEAEPAEEPEAVNEEAAE